MTGCQHTLWRITVKWLGVRAEVSVVDVTAARKQPIQACAAVMLHLSPHCRARAAGIYIKHASVSGSLTGSVFELSYKTNA